MANNNITEYQVIFADVTEGNHVYYGNFPRLLEKGRIEFLRSNKISYADFNCGLRAPVVHLEIDYKNEAKYDNIILIQTRIEKLGNTSMEFSYQLTNKVDSKVILTAKTIHVFVDKNGNKQPVPEHVRKIISP